MSVINQMLKDLEERTPAHGQTQVQAVAPKQTATVKIVLLITFVLLGLNALGYYIWNLQERVAQGEARESIAPLQPIKVAAVIEQGIQQKEPRETELVHAEPVIALQQKTEQQQALQEQTQEQKQAQSEEIKTPKIADTTPNQSNNPAPNSSLDFEKNEPTQTVKQSPTKLVIAEASPKASTPDEPKISSGKMSVTRRQLTPNELVVQTLAKAEKSVTENDIVKAEQLFEEILIIDPNHKQARKKLAALWFGRQSYQQAENLLSQGIALDRLDSEMRLMKAQIQLKQGQAEAAYNTLKPLADIEQEEYQVMLANIAQQVEQYPSAIMAYKVLIKMQPYSGRWYLGLAIVYDKNSQFSLAINAYESALTKVDLSTSSVKFAKQRLQALGE